MIDNILDAQCSLGTALMDCEADFGEEGVEAGYSDIVHAIADLCTPEVGAELIRRSL